MNSPLVSVIIPNYNHAPYLPQRIASVLAQTYQGFELIILDDCSTDNSRMIINEYAAQDERIQTSFNSSNSGSPFAQWNKGVAMARGKYIWIAESDDYADPHFLETLVGRLEEYPTVDVAYCQSWVVNAQSEIIDTMQRWTDSVDTEHWKQDYLNNGQDENRNFLFHKPTIPNTSAVVFRKSRYKAVGGANPRLVMCGDWLHWIKMLEHTHVYFVAKPLNYFRRHDATTRHILTHDKVLTKIREEYQILAYILERTNPEPALKKKLLHDYFERSFNFCPARLKFSRKFLEFINIVKKVDAKAYYRLILFIFKRMITYIPDKLTSCAAHLPNRIDESETSFTR